MRQKKPINWTQKQYSMRWHWQDKYEGTKAIQKYILFEMNLLLFSAPSIAKMLHLKCKGSLG